MKWHKVFVAACVGAAGATLSTAAFAEGEEEAAAEPPKEEVLLTEIRDLLKAQAEANAKSE